MLPNFYYNPGVPTVPSRISGLSGTDRERDILNLTPNPQLNFKARVLRAMDCCNWILGQLYCTEPNGLNRAYGEEFIEVMHGATPISVKLLEPHLVVNIASVGICTYLSDLVLESLVLYFIKPVKDGKPTCLPIKETPTVERDVVRGFFYCLGQAGVTFNVHALRGIAAEIDKGPDSVAPRLLAERTGE